MSHTDHFIEFIIAYNGFVYDFVACLSTKVST